MNICNAPNFINLDANALELPNHKQITFGNQFKVTSVIRIKIVT